MAIINYSPKVYITDMGNTPEMVLKELEIEILENADKFNAYDMSVFFKPSFRNIQYLDDFMITRTENCVDFKFTKEYTEIESTSLYNHHYAYNPTSYTTQNNVWFDHQNHEISRRTLVQYDCYYIFEKTGFCGFQVKKDKSNILTVAVGDDKILIDRKWYDKEGFEEEAFQYSLVNKPTTFDIFYLSSVLKKFNAI